MLTDPHRSAPILADAPLAVAVRVQAAVEALGYAADQLREDHAGGALPVPAHADTAQVVECVAAWLDARASLYGAAGLGLVGELVTPP